MARDYAKVSPLFWTGNTGREIRARGQECQLAALYLMTGPSATMLGVYHMPAVLLAHAIGSSLEGASKALRSLSEGGFCVYDESSEWVWVREMAAWQIDDELDASDNRVKGIAKDWLALPNLPFLQEFYDRYAAAFHLPKRRLPQAPSKALQSPSQAPPKPGAGTGTGEGTRTGEKTLSDKSDFARWYAAYPRHEAKGDAEKAWRAVKPLPALDVLLAAVEWQKRDGCLRAREADGRSLIPLPATWLRKARWLDERPTTGGGGADPSIFRDCRP
jgi:hypothetical protein